jgi:hypothetical protein
MRRRDAIQKRERIGISKGELEEACSVAGKTVSERDFGAAAAKICQALAEHEGDLEGEFNRIWGRLLAAERRLLEGVVVTQGTKKGSE